MDLGRTGIFLAVCVDDEVLSLLFQPGSFIEADVADLAVGVAVQVVCKLSVSIVGINDLRNILLRCAMLLRVVELVVEVLLGVEILDFFHVVEVEKGAVAVLALVGAHGSRAVSAEFLLSKVSKFVDNHFERSSMTTCFLENGT